jgi:hypothetical protein
MLNGEPAAVATELARQLNPDAPLALLLGGIKKL